MKKIYCLLVSGLMCISSLTAQTTTQNYIRKSVPTKAMTGKSSYSVDEALLTVSYFDGLGRSTQQVQWGITPTKKDLVTFTSYNKKGLVSKEWIPTPTESINDGEYVTPSSFVSRANSFHNDEYAYHETLNEESPINRVTNNIAPGAFLRTSNRNVRISYLTNDATSKLLVYKYSVTSAGYLYKNGNYGANQLQVKQILDEDTRYYLEFTDWEGKVLLIRRQESESVYYDTYFVYDNQGKLRFVLPPMASEGLSANTTYTTSHTLLKQYAFIYGYDAYGNCISKKLPGAEPIYYIYNRQNRLLLQQDGNQRNKSEWTFFLYDYISRPVITGIATFTKTLTQLREEYKNVTGKIDIDNDVPYYTDSSKGYVITLPSSTKRSLLTIMYYDDYRFLPSSSSLKYVSNTNGDAAELKATGLMTGMCSYALDGSKKEVVNAIYYDKKGRIVQERSLNLVNGTDNTYTKYNFLGNPTSQYIQHTGYGATVTELYSYTYDHAGRVSKVTHKLNSGTTRTLQTNTYTELGQLKSKKMDNLNAINYTYHLRNWLASISSEFFEQINYYETNSSGQASSSRTGNITQSYYTTKYNDASTGAVKSVTNTYFYTYDKLNRLKTSSNTNGSGESFSYDKNGNILNLTRDYKGSIEDHIFFSYNGNQLTTAFDDYMFSRYMDELMQFTGKTYLSGQTYFYDNNGNMTKDLYREVEEVVYNSLNLPNRINFSNGNYIEYVYTADGRKHKVKYGTAPQRVMLPMGNMLDDAPNPLFSAVAPASQLFQTDSTEYCGNYIYENRKLTKILTSDGYIDYTPSSSTKTYCYYIKDHLGSNRLVVDQNKKIIQAVEYYPSGIMFSLGSPVLKDNRLHTGKELDRMHGLNLYDNMARQHDAITSRFTTMDPLAEKYYDISPYAHCGNNPIRFIDPDGRKNRKAGPYENPSSATTGSSVGKVTAASSKITSTGARIIGNSNENYGNYETSPNEVSISITGEMREGNPKMGDVNVAVMASFDGDQTLNVENYVAVAGGFGNGAPENGNYSVNTYWDRSPQGNFNSGMNKDGVGFSYHLNPNFSTGRTDLRIHPDGNREGTQGCIGLSGNSVELNSFKGVINSTLQTQNNISTTINITNNPNNNGRNSNNEIPRIYE